MITKDIARLIYNCYSEIENGEKMIEELKKAIDENGDLIINLININNNEKVEIQVLNSGTVFNDTIYSEAQE